ncbi:hypothetical protein D3C77_670390 [compost metagenome]
MTAPQVTRTLKVTPLPRWFTRKYDSRPAARTVTTHVMDANSISLPLRQPPYPSAQQQPIRLAISRAPTCARLFHWKETGAPDTAAALIAHGSAAIPLVTIGVTNADVTSNSHADDGAADQGMDCT